MFSTAAQELQHRGSLLQNWGHFWLEFTEPGVSVAATSDAVAEAAAPPALPGSLCSEVVEARVHEGLHFRTGGQTIRFGDSPQVGFTPSLATPPVALA